MPAPFFVFLTKKHTLSKVTSYDASTSESARELQLLIDAGNNVEYRKRLANLREEGKTFRLTDMRVYETKDEGETIDVKVALQVKGYSITWYFWVKDGKDQYPQDFRDLLYKAAGECHTKVTNGCDLYYRGSNAFHVKTMHHLEIEANHNHNHYRMKDNQPVTPKDLREHLTAFKTHEVHDIFFEEGEVETLCGMFDKFYEKWTHKREDELSPEEEYMSQPSQRLNEADLIEFNLFGLQQEPCRISVEELQLDFDHAREAIESSIISNDTRLLQDEIEKLIKEFDALMEYRKVGGSRGLGAERAMTRQIEGSTMPTIPTVADKDDAIGIKVPVIPEWAVHAQKSIAIARQKVEEMAQKTKMIASEKGIKGVENDSLEALSIVNNESLKENKLEEIESPFPTPPKQESSLKASTTVRTLFNNTDKVSKNVGPEMVVGGKPEIKSFI